MAPTDAACGAGRTSPPSVSNTSPTRSSASRARTPGSDERQHDHQVTPSGDNQWRVVVVQNGTTTVHEVTIPDGCLRGLGIAHVSAIRVMEESFRFLLEREPNTSILRSFELPLITRYFPEYPEKIRQRLS